jgi:hypothetical protein
MQIIERLRGSTESCEHLPDTIHAFPTVARVL